MSLLRDDGGGSSDNDGGYANAKQASKFARGKFRRARIVLMGASQAGKSTFAFRVVTGLFVPEYTLTLENVFARAIQGLDILPVDEGCDDSAAAVSHISIGYDLYDVSSAAFTARTKRDPNYYVTADAAIVIYDPHNDASVYKAEEIIRLLYDAHGADNAFPICVLENVRSRNVLQQRAFRSLSRYLPYNDREMSFHSTNLCAADRKRLNDILRTLVVATLERGSYERVTRAISPLVPIAEANDARSLKLARRCSIL